MSQIESVSEESLGDMFEEVVRLVRLGGELVRKAIYQEKQVEEKTSHTDVVTATDTAVEALLIDGLKQKFPGHNFIGEESIAAQDGNIKDFPHSPTWIIDPIDGTLNFVHSNPMVSMSVGLAINRRMEIGIVYLPVFDQMYTARRAKGAELNGRKIGVSICKELSKAMVMFELWASSGADVTLNHRQTVAQLLEKTHCIRSSGSAAINLAFVAGGQADAYFHSGIHCWDMAAGALLVKEAGGVVLDPSGREFDLMSRKIMVASTQELAGQIIQDKLGGLDYEKEYPDVCPL